MQNTASDTPLWTRFDRAHAALAMAKVATARSRVSEDIRGLAYASLDRLSSALIKLDLATTCHRANLAAAA